MLSHFIYITGNFREAADVVYRHVGFRRVLLREQGLFRWQDQNFIAGFSSLNAGKAERRFKVFGPQGNYVR